MRRRQEEQVEAAIRENEENDLRVLRKNEERMEGLRMEYQEKEDKLEKEVEEKEEKLKQEYEAALAELGNMKRERKKNLMREFSEVEEQLTSENMAIEKKQKRKNEESLALLLDQNEVELAKLVAKQNEGERVGKKRKADQFETATMNKPIAPECPVNFVKKNNFHFPISILKGVLRRDGASNKNLPLRQWTSNMRDLQV